MIKKIVVSLGDRAYPILISPDFGPLAAVLKKGQWGTDAFIITNKHIRRLYAADITQHFSAAGIHPWFYEVADSEHSKSLRTYAAAVKKLSSLDARRRFFLVALGGGVIGDLTGFIAATYKRGIPYMQIPTTLLGQVDSAIGGKTAIDLPSGKNLLGAFYQPVAVFSNTSLLKTLPVRQVKSGLAEVIKYGVIADPELFAYCENHASAILGVQSSAIQRIVTAASAIKARVVALDEREKGGLRAILNYGHTLGHALETASGYGTFAHGEAVSIGMVCAARLSADMGFLAPGEAVRIERLLVRYGLPVAARGVKMVRLKAAFLRDKKFISGTIRMVLPRRIGHAMVCDNIPRQCVERVIAQTIGK